MPVPPHPHRGEGSLEGCPPLVLYWLSSFLIASSILAPAIHCRTVPRRRFTRTSSIWNPILFRSSRSCGHTWPKLRGSGRLRVLERVAGGMLLASWTVRRTVMVCTFVPEPFDDAAVSRPFLRPMEPATTTSWVFAATFVSRTASSADSHFT